MFAVIFGVQPRADRWDQYLSLAAQLRPELERIDGFIDNERFRSLRAEGRLLSLSIWANEKSVIRWRTHALHHAVQEKGRTEVFEDYHLRVGEITSDSDLPGQVLPQQRLDATDVGAAKTVTISEAMDPASLAYAPLTGDAEMFQSITTPGKHLLLRSWHDAAAAEAWQPPAPARHRRVRVIRDYGLLDRREAPQFYPTVARGSGGG